MAQILTWDDFIDLKNTASIDEALKLIQKINQEYKQFTQGTEKELKDLTKAQEDYVNSLKEVAKQVSKVSPYTKEGREEIAKYSKEVEIAAEQNKKYQKQISTLEKAVEKLTKEQKDFNKATNETNKLSKEQQKLTQKLIQLDSKEAQEVAKLRVQIQEKNKALRESAKETLGVVKEQSLFSKNQERLVDLLENSTGALGQATQGVKGLGASFKALLANPVVLVISAIVGAISALFSIFKTTTQGAVLFEKVLNGISVGFKTLISQIGRFLTGEISLKQLFTGTADAIERNIRLSSRLVDERRKLTKQNQLLERSIARNNVQGAKEVAIRDSNTTSLNKRLKAGERFAKIQKENAQLAVDVARNNLLLAESNQSLAKSDEEKLEAQEAYNQALIAQRQAEAEQIATEAEAVEQIRQLKQDLFEQELDLLIDLSDNEKTINERRIASDRTSLAEKIKLQEENTKIVQENVQKQIKAFEKLNGVILDQNLLFEGTPQAILEYAKANGLSEQGISRLREVIIEARTAGQDLKETNDEVFGTLPKLVTDAQATLPELPKTVDELAKSSKKAEEAGKRLAFTFGDSFKIVLKSLKENVSEVFDSVFGIFSGFTERQQQKDDERIEKLNQQREEELAKAGDNAKAREAIEKRFDDAQARIQQRQAKRAERLAKFEKALAITQSVIDTQRAVLAALSQKPGPPLTIPAAIAAGVLGAARTAAIIAQPIPAFAKGTDDAPGGLAMVGEKGRELVMQPDGKVYLTGNKAELRDIPEGSKILTNSITENILKGKYKDNNDSSARVLESVLKQQRESINAQAKVFFERETDILIQGFKKSIGDLPIHNTNITERGFNHSVEKVKETRSKILRRNSFGR